MTAAIDDCVGYGFQLQMGEGWYREYEQNRRRLDRQEAEIRGRKVVQKWTRKKEQRRMKRSRGDSACTYQNDWHKSFFELQKVSFGEEVNWEWTGPRN